MADRVASPADESPRRQTRSRRAPGGATWDCRRRGVKKLTSGFPAARIGRGGPPGRRVRQIVVDMLHSREFDPFGPFCADANPAPSEASPPCAVAPLPHARLPMNSSLDETKGKFSSLQSIEKSQNVEIIAQSGGIHIVCERRPKTSTLAAPSEAPPPCVVAPLPHARLLATSSLEETEGKFSSLQSIEKSQNVEIISQSDGIHIVRERRPKTSTLAAPSEAPPPCVVAPLPHARGPANSSLDETGGKFSSLQSIEESQNEKILAVARGFVSPRMGFAINVRRASGPGRNSGSERARAARSGSSRNGRARRACPK